MALTLTLTLTPTHSNPNPNPNPNPIPNPNPNPSPNPIPNPNPNLASPPTLTRHALGRARRAARSTLHHARADAAGRARATHAPQGEVSQLLAHRLSFIVPICLPLCLPLCLPAWRCSAYCASCACACRPARARHPRPTRPRRSELLTYLFGDPSRWLALPPRLVR